MLASGNIAANTAVIASHAQVTASGDQSCVSSNMTTAYTCTHTSTPAWTAYGQFFLVVADVASNSSASVTADGLTTLTLYRDDCATSIGTDIPAGGSMWFMYNGTKACEVAAPPSSGSGITQLTGDVTAGPGSGSQAATLATVNSNVGSFTNANITVNAKGLVTAAANGSAGGGSGVSLAGPSLVSFPSPVTTQGIAFQFSGQIQAQNGFVNAGVPVGTMSSPISLTSQTAAISTATLCAASSGACGTAGMYRLSFYLNSTNICSVPGSGAVGLSITYTDDIGTKSAQAVPLDVSGGTSLSGTLALGTTTGNATASVNLWSSGANTIQYATSYVACGTGTGTYSLRASVERLF
jgi:hypothetical protein